MSIVLIECSIAIIFQMSDHHNHFLVGAHPEQYAQKNMIVGVSLWFIGKALTTEEVGKLPFTVYMC